MRLALKAEMHGLERFPGRGPALVVFNHLGDADVPLIVGGLPAELDGFVKIEMYSFPILGTLLQGYGVIWVHRGRPDRRALRTALEGLAEGRIIAIAPEGRYTRAEGLEFGSGGAAFLARHADVPILPVALTGTENDLVYPSLRRLKRAPVTLTVGVAFKLGDEPGTRQRRSDRLAADTERIMQSLADLLPPEYRGVYGAESEK
jgi:1-acyl-sn-glycerol-3-phosphate acyltransferase